MKKKIVFCAYDLDIGGIETALMSLLKNLDYNEYEVSLFLTKKQGVFLSDLPKEVKIIDYDIAEDKNVIIRKFKNFKKLMYFKRKYKNKFDFSIAYATTIKACTKLAYHFSRNNAIWIHGDYTVNFNTTDKMKKFVKFINLNKYKKVVFVANSIKNNFEKFGVDIKGKVYVFNNFIDADRIKKLAEENLIDTNKTTFVNVSRHDESQKNLLMMLKVINRLIKDGYDFDLWMIGDGPDRCLYENYVNENNLNDVVHFLGKKANPFVYYRASDAVLLSSTMEGNPVVFMEAKVIGVPIITTDVSDAKDDIKDKYGIVTACNEEEYYKGVKQFLDNGFESLCFDATTFNQEILNKFKMVVSD